MVPIILTCPAVEVLLPYLDYSISNNDLSVISINTCNVDCQCPLVYQCSMIFYKTLLLRGHRLFHMSLYRLSYLAKLTTKLTNQLKPLLDSIQN